MQIFVSVNKVLSVHRVMGIHMPPNAELSKCGWPEVMLPLPLFPAMAVMSSQWDSHPLP